MLCTAYAAPGRHMPFPRGIPQWKGLYTLAESLYTKQESKGKGARAMKLDRAEALRYLGASGKRAPALVGQVEDMAHRLEGWLSPKYVYRVFPLSFQDGTPYLSPAGLALPGRLAKTMLAGCTQAALLACTLGTEFDRRLQELQARSMAEAVILDACGSAYVEAGCQQAQADLSAALPQLYLTDRFSPGYGDLPLSLQPALCEILDVQRRLGLYVTDSLLLNPMKSVTAILGLAPTPRPTPIRGCAVCPNRGECAYRKGGSTCV